MATRYSSIFSGASTRPFATRFTVGVATCVAAVLVAGCNDPELEKQLSVAEEVMHENRDVLRKLAK